MSRIFYLSVLKSFLFKASRVVWLFTNGDVIRKSHWSILYMSHASGLKTSADLMLDHWVRPAGLALFQFTDRLCWEAHARSHLRCSFHWPSSALSSSYLQKCLTGWIVINLTLTSPPAACILDQCYSKLVLCACSSDSTSTVWTFEF